MITSILNTTDTVKELLIKYPSLRNDDKRLVANFWSFELKTKGIKLDSIPVKDFIIDYFLKGEITNPDTITRARRKVQELNPDLRGDVWAKRKSLEKEIRRNI